MKRDMDLVRAILFALEDWPPNNFLPTVIPIDGHTDKEVAYHVHLMGQAGLLVTGNIQSYSDPLPQATANSVTWAGHDFADAARSPVVWEKTKKALAKIGGAGFDVVVATVKELAKQAMRDQGILLP